MANNYVIELVEEEINTLLAALDNVAHRIARPLIDKILGQAQPQAQVHAENAAKAAQEAQVQAEGGVKSEALPLGSIGTE